MNYEKYLTQEEMKEIAIETFKDTLREKTESDIVRMVSNAAYEAVFHMVDAATNGNLDQQISEKVVEVIDGLTEFSLFRPRDVFQREESPAYKLLHQTVENNSEMITERVQKQISKITKGDVIDLIVNADGPEITVKF